MADENPVEGTGPAETPEGQFTEAKETDWKAEARKWESRAKENLSAAKANEGAAKRLAEIEEANKTDAEKIAARVEAAEKRAAELELRATRAEVAAAKGVPADLLSGSTQDELEASADALLTFKGETEKPSPFPKADPSQGVKGTAGSGTTADKFAAFMEKKLS